MLKRLAASALLSVILTVQTPLVQQLPSPEATKFEVEFDKEFKPRPYREAVATIAPVKDKPIVRRLTSYDAKQIKCLTDNLYHEGRGEPRAGKIAIVDVVFNRTKSSKFPKTPCGVVYQRNKHGCQFSWTCKGNKAIRNRVVYNDLEKLTTELYSKRVEVTRGATYYHANYIRPRWANVFSRTVKFGNHTFYRE